MSDTLLPLNSSPQERALEQATARVDAVAAVGGTPGPIVIRNLWDPDTCPVELLPWLAWALSVDVWDPSWTEAQRRQAIRDSVSIHRTKGTAGAVEKALLPYDAVVTEWFEDEPVGPAYTFRIEAQIATAQQQTTIESIIERSKNARSHYTFRQSIPAGKLYVAAVCCCGDIVAVAQQVNPLVTYRFASADAFELPGEYGLTFRYIGPTSINGDGINYPLFRLQKGYRLYDSILYGYYNGVNCLQVKLDSPSGSSESVTIWPAWVERETGAPVFNEETAVEAVNFKIKARSIGVWAYFKTDSYGVEFALEEHKLHLWYQHPNGITATITTTKSTSPYTVSGTFTLPNCMNAWQHFALVYDNIGNALKLYANGVLRLTLAVPAGDDVWERTPTIRIEKPYFYQPGGQWYYGNAYTGLRYKRNPWSDAEVLDIYSAGPNG